jgi:hypothetical protein
VLTLRGQIALELVRTLQNSLARTLESLGPVVPPVKVEAASVRDMALRGMPAPDLMSLSVNRRWNRAWLFTLLLSLGRWALRHSLKRQVGPLAARTV